MQNCVRLLLFICCTTLLFSACTKEYSNETGATQIATGTLKDSTGNCLPDSVAGTFYDGITPGADTAFVEIQVNVAKTGSYSIITDLQNGFEFADSGFFTSTGLNIIRLKPIGTPILPKSTLFTVSFDSSFCTFAVNVQDSTGTGIQPGGGGIDTVGSGDPDAGSGSWQFTTSDGTFKGTFYRAFITVDSNIWASGGKMLALEGFTSSAKDSSFALLLYLPTGAITTGSYNTQSMPPLNAGFFEFDSYDLATDEGTPIYASSLATSIPTNTTIDITSYDANTHIVSGTFSGTAETGDSSGKTTNVTNGSFTATVSP